jgi:hypothetical protein
MPGAQKSPFSAVRFPYADIHEKRSLATLRAMRFGYWFLVLQLSIAVPWLTWDFVPTLDPRN